MSSQISRRNALLLGSSALLVAACAPPPPPKKRRKNTRRIGINLWAGTERTKEKWPEIDVTAGRSGNRRIRGPLRWPDPISGQTVLTYERTKTKNAGVKRQLYTITHDGAALGRVMDERPGAITRRFENEAMFPLGKWKRGEERQFDSITHTAAGPAKRKITIKIRQLDYKYKGIKHSLKYDWTAQDSAGRILFKERYIYSPGKGLVSFKNLLKKK
ncbi:MAG: hypothetical protein ACPGGK_06555 [Pikeienuella sp.]